MQCNGIQGKERATDIWSYLHLQTLLHWSWSWGETTNLSFKISHSCRLLARWVSVRPLVAHILKKIVSFFICCLTKFFTWAGPIAYFEQPLFNFWLKAWTCASHPYHNILWCNFRCWNYFVQYTKLHSTMPIA